MRFTLKLTNFSKIENATLHFDDLTVIAGNNSIGKNYISKSLYCIFDALIDDPQQRYYSNLTERFSNRLERIKRQVSRNLQSGDIAESIDSVFIEFIDKIGNVELQVDSINKDLSDNIVGDRDKYFIDLFRQLFEEQETFLDKINNSLNNANNLLHKADTVKSYVRVLEEEFNDLGQRLNKWTYEEKINQGYLNLITDKLIDNFQIINLHDLRGDKADEETAIELDMEKGKVSLRIDTNGILSGNVVSPIGSFISNIIYLASPVYWMLLNPLSRISVRRIIGGREYLGDIPKYIHDSFTTLDWKSLDDSNSTIDSIVKDITETIGGEIKYDSRRRKLEFFETESREPRGVSLLLASNGIVQLGMLAFFIKNRTIDKGAMLVIDEPEAYLHPEWEEKIMQVLYNLKQHGVQVIMSRNNYTVRQHLAVSLKSNEIHDGIAVNICNTNAEVDGDNKQFDFWKGFVDYMDNPDICHHEVKNQNSYTLRLAPSAGLRIALKISEDSIRYRVYFPPEKNDLFDFLKNLNKDINEELDEDVKWLSTGGGNEIVKTLPVEDVYDKGRHLEYYKWFKSQALLVMDVLPKYIEQHKAAQK